MNYTHYDFEGLWFDTFKKVLSLNVEMNSVGLDKSQLKEVATSIFIAKSQRGIVRPEIEDDLPCKNPAEFPANNRGNGNGISGFGIQIASPKQIITIKGLLKNPKVNPKERQRIQDLLAEPEVDKT
ncbi:MAG: hypothetical protein Q7J65_05760 [Candidatus Marinimicrobia bacterium]|nr:hypothetical protein [Candidatus Neomarinimicrobiota bacterium]